MTRPDPNELDRGKGSFASDTEPGSPVFEYH